jgi:hypothetical protein
MKYIVIIILNSFAIFGADKDMVESLQYIHSVKGKRSLIQLTHKLSGHTEVYARRTFPGGQPVIEAAILNHKKKRLRCKKMIFTSKPISERLPLSFFEEIRQQYHYHFTKQTNAHRSAFIALNMLPAPFITKEKEKLIHKGITLNAQEMAKTYFIFNTDNIRTKVASDICLQRTTDSEDEIISWSLKYHEKTAKTIYDLASTAYEKQVLGDLRIYNQDHHQK